LRGRFIDVLLEDDDRSVGSLPIRYTERDQLAYLRGPLLALRQFCDLGGRQDHFPSSAARSASIAF
jgi:hypothetical protein